MSAILENQNRVTRVEFPRRAEGSFDQRETAAYQNSLGIAGRRGVRLASRASSPFLFP